MKTYIFYVNRLASAMDMQQYNQHLDNVKEGVKVREFIKDGQYAEVGDKAYFVMLHYWDKGICACGIIEDITMPNVRARVLSRLQLPRLVRNGTDY